jgi:membrane-associated phospholipid phosphatase
LAMLYPRGRFLFAAFAMSVGLQRILGSAHYPSDVLVGAAVGWFCAVAVTRFRQRQPGTASAP